MNYPRECPECGRYDTEILHTEFMTDEIEQVRGCQDCHASYTVAYGDPILREVRDRDGKEVA